MYDEIKWIVGTNAAGYAVNETFEQCYNIVQKMLF